MLHLTHSLPPMLAWLISPLLLVTRTHTHTFLVDEDSGFDFMVLGLVYLHVSLFAPTLARYASCFVGSRAREKEFFHHCA